jgi:hypothetical protein
MSALDALEALRRLRRRISHPHESIDGGDDQYRRTQLLALLISFSAGSRICARRWGIDALDVMHGVRLRVPRFRTAGLAVRASRRSWKPAAASAAAACPRM